VKRFKEFFHSLRVDTYSRILHFQPHITAGSFGSDYRLPRTIVEAAHDPP
jgi:hypothetical protein